MLQQENEAYGPYAPSYQQKPFESVAVLEDATATHAPAEQDTSPLPLIPPGSKAPLQAQNRQGRGGAILLFTLVLAIIFGVGLFAGLEYAGSSTGSTTTTTKSVATTTTTSSSGSTIETLQETAIAKIEPAVVEIKVITVQGEQIGSGVIVDTNGDIVTNNHVVSGEQTIEVVLSNGSTEQAQLVGTATADDLAVVRIQPFAHMTVAQIGDSSKLVVGQEVMAIGNPLGITETATNGIVSALNRSVTESTGTTISKAIQTDAAVNPGNSGGALINLQGQLIGIPTLTAVNTESNTAANGVSFAIPSNLVVTDLHQILQQ
ncbi:MAG: trypsin-like serine protease [Chloroflexi bacterium]|nr:MAG: trypsin-like serine protease [Chloroflexota bacterium]